MNSPLNPFFPFLSGSPLFHSIRLTTSQLSWAMGPCIYSNIFYLLCGFTGVWWAWQLDALWRPCTRVVPALLSSSISVAGTNSAVLGLQFWPFLGHILLAFPFWVKIWLRWNKKSWISSWELLPGSWDSPSPSAMTIQSTLGNGAKIWQIVTTKGDLLYGMLWLSLSSSRQIPV